MLILKATTEILEVLTTSAAGIDYSITWVDMTTTTNSPSSSEGKITTATTTTVVAAPASSTQRIIKYAAFRNIHGSTSNVLTIKKDISGTEYYMTASVTLAFGEVLEYVDAVGWRHIDANGQIMGVGATGATGASATWTDVTVTDANFTAADNTRYYLPTGVLSASRTVNMASITTRCMFVIEDVDYILTYTGASVYGFGGTEAFTEIQGALCTTVEKIGSKLIITG